MRGSRGWEIGMRGRWGFWTWLMEVGVGIGGVLGYGTSHSELARWKPITSWVALKRYTELGAEEIYRARDEWYRLNSLGESS